MVGELLVAPWLLIYPCREYDHLELLCSSPNHWIVYQCMNFVPEISLIQDISNFNHKKKTKNHKSGFPSQNTRAFPITCLHFVPFFPGVHTAPTVPLPGHIGLQVLQQAQHGQDVALLRGFGGENVRGVETWASWQAENHRKLLRETLGFHGI